MSGKNKPNLQAQTLTQVVHLLFFTRMPTSAQNPLWIQCVLGLSCSISVPSSQIIKGELMLPVHYTRAKWNHNENLPLTVIHDCIIPLPPIRSGPNPQTQPLGAFHFLFPASCFSHESLTNQLVTSYLLLFQLAMPCTLEVYCLKNRH